MSIAPHLDSVRAGAAHPTEGRLVYAVGDVHGRLDLLEPLVAGIVRDAIRTRPAQRPMIILLGDYVDRGPDSRGVIAFILDLMARGALEVRALKGNHEEALQTFLQDAGFGSRWMNFGGGETLRSYGVAPPSRQGDEAGWTATQKAFAAALPAEHLAFIEGLELMIVVGDYAFVHAGVDPDRPLDRQQAHDLIWIRDEFLTSTRPLEKTIVHGHSPSVSPQVWGSRLGIDTGAFATGVLTALRLDGADRRLIQVAPAARPSVERVGRRWEAATPLAAR